MTPIAGDRRTAVETQCRFVYAIDRGPIYPPCVCPQSRRFLARPKAARLDGDNKKSGSAGMPNVVGIAVQAGPTIVVDRQNRVFAGR